MGSPDKISALDGGCSSSGDLNKQLEDATELDPSILQRPVNAGVRNVQHILRCIKNGTPEVRDLIFNECSVIYECKVCSNLFRSLANFLAHKRFYCTEHCCEYVNNFMSRSEESEMVVLQPEKLEQTDQDGEKSSTTPSESDPDEQFACPDSPTIVVPFFAEENATRPKEESNSTQIQYNKEYQMCTKKEIVVQLKPITGNPNAVYQQLCSPDKVQTSSGKLQDSKDSPMKQASSELAGKAPNIRIIIPNKNISTPASPTDQSKALSTSNIMTRKKRLECRKDCDVSTLSCLKCETTYTSIKTLYLHMMTIHAQKRLFYPCLYCSASFVQVWGVIRHIVTAHQKSKEQVAKLREIIRRRAFMKKVNTGSPKSNTAAQSPAKKMQQLTNKFKSVPFTENSSPKKSNVLHGCEKCGRMFTRRSSKISHEKFCKGPTAAATPQPAETPPKPPTPRSTERTLPPSTISTRPKRLTEKKVPKDFVNSQTLKWRSANKVEMNSPTKSEKSQSGEKEKPKKESDTYIPKKAMAIMDKQKLICLKCHRKFFSVSNLFRHVAIHVGWTRFKCKHCSYQCYSKSDCRNHIQKVHVSSTTSLSNIDKLIIDLPSAEVVIHKVDEVAHAKKKTSPTSRASASKPSSPIKPKQADVKLNKGRYSPDRRKHLSGEKSPRDGASHPVSCTPFIITARKSTSTGLRTHITPKQVIGVDAGMVHGGDTHYIPTRHSPRSAESTSLTTLVTRSGIYPKSSLLPINLYPSERSRVKKTGCDGDFKLKCEPAS